MAKTTKELEVQTPDEPTKTTNILTAKLAVMHEVGYCQKVKSSGLSYTYASEGSLIQALRPAMLSHGIVIKCLSIEPMEATSYTTSKGSTLQLVRAKYTYRFTHAESGTYDDVEAIGEASDAGDKAYAKAATIAYKYALRQSFVIETGDDPDQFASEPAAAQQKSAPAKQKPEVVKKVEAVFGPAQISTAENPWNYRITTEKSPSCGMALWELPQAAWDRIEANPESALRHFVEADRYAVMAALANPLAHPANGHYEG